MVNLSYHIKKISYLVRTVEHMEVWNRQSDQWMNGQPEERRYVDTEIRRRGGGSLVTIWTMVGEFPSFLGPNLDPHSRLSVFRERDNLFFLPPDAILFLPSFI